jgi:hypothetical protein
MKVHRRTCWPCLGLLAISLNLAACGTDGSGLEGTLSAGAGAGSTNMQRVAGATYRVPVPDSLSAWASYPVEEVEFERSGSRVQIRYPFPRWLSGDSENIELEGVAPAGADGFDVTADQGSGRCTRTGSRFECLETLPGLEIDRDKARDRMVDAGLAATEVEQRLEVTRIFEADPIGILEFELDR